MGHLVGLPSLLVLVAAALLALGLTLLRQAVRGGTLPGCGGADDGCGAVTRGRWARVGPVPMAAPGALVYAALLAAAVQVHPALAAWVPAPVRATAAAVAVTAALTAAGAGLWLAALQAVVIRQFCPYCMAAHGLAVAAAALAVTTTSQGSAGAVLSPAAWPAGGPAVWAAGLVAAFAAVQCLVRPRLYAVTPAPSLQGSVVGGAADGVAAGTVADDATPGGSDERAAPRAAVAFSDSRGLPSAGPDAVGQRLPVPPGAAPRGLPPAAPGDVNTAKYHMSDDGVGPEVVRAEPVPSQPGAESSAVHRSTPVASPSNADLRPAAGRRVTLAGGNLSLSAADWPLLGPADAPHVLALLADPTCKACRQMHRTLIEAVALAGGRLAVACVPVPMDPACNPAAAGRKPRTRTDVCDYARLTLALHAAAPTAHPAFERWLLDQPEAPPVDQARRHAVALVPEVEAAWQDPAGPLAAAAERALAAAVAAYRAARLTQVPALLLPAAAIAGQLPPPAALLDLLGRELGLATATGATPASATVRSGSPFASGTPIVTRPPPVGGI